MGRYLTLHIVLALVFGAFLAGCGGGGGGGVETTVTGVVLDSARGDQPVEGARVVIGGATATTERDGRFVIRGPQVGANTATVTPPGGDAQTIGFAPPIAPGPNGRIELIINIGQIRGRVLDPAGQPAANALVTVISTGDNVATGADGRFRIDNVPATTTEITAVLGTASVSRTVTIGTGLTDIGDLVLVNDPNPNPPGAPTTILGTVTLSTGGPAAGVTLLLLQNGVERERTLTNSDGSYGFYVPVGSYTVRAVREGFQNAEAAVSVTNPAQPVRADLVLQPAP